MVGSDATRCALENLSLSYRIEVPKAFRSAFLGKKKPQGPGNPRSCHARGERSLEEVVVLLTR
jgi:hypothetical protein